jgi:integrase
MATIKFYPYKKTGTTKVYLRLKIGRKKDFRLSTLLTIEDAKSWKYLAPLPKKSTEKNKSLCKRLNALQELIEDKIDEVEKSDTLSLRDINGKWLKRIIFSFNNENPISDSDLLTEFAQNFTNSLNNSTYKRKGVQYPYTQNTINKYQNFTRQLKEFEEHVGKTFYVYDVDESFNSEFLKFLSDVKKLAVNTKGMYVKRLKTIVKNAELNDIKVNPKYNNIRGFEAENIVTFLSFEEIYGIVQTPMPTERLDVAKDWFIVACYTAQRVSDLHRLTSRNIQSIDGGKYLVFKQFKTKLSVEVPLHHYVESIIKKYKGNFPPNFSKNEQSNRSTLSTLIKEVCRISGIREKVRGRYNGVIGIYPKWKLISNHTGRRSFACNFYTLAEWTNAMIMNITGHVNESNFYKYIDREDKTLSRQGWVLFDNMKKNAGQVEPQLKIVNEANE